MHEAEIFYFTGTGNSLAVARRIAAGVNGRLTAIPGVMAWESIETKADALGIVFPVYYGENDRGVPSIVGRFAGRLRNLEGKYIFAVCTSGYLAGETLGNLGEAVAARGGKLAAGFVVNMSGMPFGRELLKKICLLCGARNLAARIAAGGTRRREEARQKKLDLIIDTINERGRRRLETPGVLGRLLFAPILLLLIRPVFLRRYRTLAGGARLPFAQLIPLADNSFRTDGKCNGCGICARVCPVQNIHLEDGRPVWQHHCETCYACYQWCPQDAIRGEIVKYNERYHHPEVNLADMLRNHRADG